MISMFSDDPGNRPAYPYARAAVRWKKIRPAVKHLATEPLLSAPRRFLSHVDVPARSVCMARMIRKATSQMDETCKKTCEPKFEKCVQNNT